MRTTHKVPSATRGPRVGRCDRQAQESPAGRHHPKDIPRGRIDRDHELEREVGVRRPNGNLSGVREQIMCHVRGRFPTAPVEWSGRHLPVQCHMRTTTSSISATARSTSLPFIVGMERDRTDGGH